MNSTIPGWIAVVFAILPAALALADCWRNKTFPLHSRIFHGLAILLLPVAGSVVYFGSKELISPDTKGE